MLPRLRKIVMRSILWIAAFAFLLLYRWAYSFDQKPLSSFMLAFNDLICMFGCSLLINRLLVPKLLQKKRTLLFFVSLLFCIVIFSMLMQAGQCLWYRYTGVISTKQDFDNITCTSVQIFYSYLVVFFGCLCICAVRFFNDYWLSQNRYEQLQKEKAQTELDFLKAQINPHFLFNSMNSLYAEIDKLNPRARNIVLKFSEMLRYQLYECSADSLPVEKELAYLNNYVELQRLRKDEDLQVSFRTSGNLTGFSLAPLLLIPFIENAFKYASTHEHQPNVLDISLSRDGANLLFICRNTRDRVLSRNLFGEGGIGIRNVKRRLELLYHDRHELHITDTEHVFDVSLKLEIT